jgi:hypothetical protein
MRIELVQHKTHAVHETIHISRLPISVPRPAVRGESSLESLKILHPFDSKVVWLNVSFVED